MWGAVLTSSLLRGPVDTQELQQVALFEKCRLFTKAREIQAAGLYPSFNPISESEDTVVVIDGHKRIMLGSNNYLGLTHHPKVLEAASRALHRYGSGCTGSRFLNGTLDLHEQLEELRDPPDRPRIAFGRIDEPLARLREGLQIRSRRSAARPCPTD